MPENLGNTRRELIKAGIATGGIVILHPLSWAAQLQRAMTPSVMLGPFYPQTKPLDQDADLTRVAGDPQRAKGQLIYVRGSVLNRNGDPVANADIELWQANAAGRYSHPSDPNTAPLDPHFQGYGRQTTDSQGRFQFKTIKPGPYPTLDGTGLRTPHIHFEISGKYDRMVTQMFFEGEPLNQGDHIFNSIRRNQEGTIGKISKGVAGIEADAWLVSWNVVLLKG